MTHFGFPYHIGPDGRTAGAAADAHLHQLIEQVLFTNQGERPNRPELGAGIRQLVFAENAPELATAMQHLVTAALQRWLAELIEVRAVEVKASDATLAVTVADYAAAAEQHPEVQRAVAERRWTGSWQTVFLAVDRRGGLPVDAAFEAALRAHLEPLRLAGHDLEIEPPVMVPLDIALVVCVAEGHYAEHVAAALLETFSAGWRSDGSPGFFHPDRFTFGDPVRLSRLVSAAMAVTGVRWVGVAGGDGPAGRFCRLYNPTVDYAASGVIPIGAREVARLDNDANAPENGRLELVLEGGR